MIITYNRTDATQRLISRNEGSLAPGSMVNYACDPRATGTVIGNTYGRVTVFWVTPPDEDLEYFQKKLYAALKIPREYLGYEDEAAYEAINDPNIG